MGDDFLCDEVWTWGGGLDLVGTGVCRSRVGHFPWCCGGS